MTAATPILGYPQLVIDQWNRGRWSLNGKNHLWRRKSLGKAWKSLEFLWRTESFSLVEGKIETGEKVWFLADFSSLQRGDMETNLLWISLIENGCFTTTSDYAKCRHLQDCTSWIRKPNMGIPPAIGIGISWGYSSEEWLGSKESNE